MVIKLAKITTEICVKLKLLCTMNLKGYQPKKGFLQSQIQRLPMLYDDEYDNVNEGSGNCEQMQDHRDNTEFQELAMP